MLDRLSQYGTDTSGRGAGNMSALTVPHNFAAARFSAGNEVDEANPEEHPATGGNPVTFLFILIGLIIAMFFVQRASSVLKQETFGINWFSFFQTGVMATAFILLLKTVFGRWHVAGITPAVAAI